MDGNDLYLFHILKNYTPKSLADYSKAINSLKTTLATWAGSCFVEILDSGSRAKGTAISIASDADFIVSLTSNCNENNGGLKSIYDSLFNHLCGKYKNLRKQNVSLRVNLPNNYPTLLQIDLEVDITPAKKQTGNTNDHSLWLSKQQTWQKTNIQKHIHIVSQSNRINEIRLLKIWRELNKLDFPSIYLEFLLIEHILHGRPTANDYLALNFRHILSELAKPDHNCMLTETVTDPGNSNNILSDLLTKDEKNKIRAAAQNSNNQSSLQLIFN